MAVKTQTPKPQETSLAPQDPERRAALITAILEELEKAELSCPKIAAKLGCGLGTVYLYKQKRDKGIPITLPKKKKVVVKSDKTGPPDAEERAGLVAALAMTPAEAGMKGDHPEWTMLLARKWFSQTYGRVIRMRDIEFIIQSEGLKPIVYGGPFKGVLYRANEPKPEKNLPKPSRKENFVDEIVKVGDITPSLLQKVLRIDEDTARSLMSNAMAPMSAPSKPSKPAPAAKPTTAAAGEKIGRNSPCPKGQPLKFKQCCGKRGLKDCDGRGPE